MDGLYLPVCHALYCAPVLCCAVCSVWSGTIFCRATEHPAAPKTSGYVRGAVVLGKLICHILCAAFALLYPSFGSLRFCLMWMEQVPI